MPGPICSYVDFIIVLSHVKKLLFKTYSYIFLLRTIMVVLLC